MIAVAFGATEWMLASSVVALIGCISVVAWAETVIGRTSRARAAAMVNQHGRRAERVFALASDPERYVNVMLLLLLMLQLSEATLVGVLGARLFGPVGLVVASLVNVIVVFVVAEAAPKTWALEHPDSAMAAAPLVDLLARFPPLRLLSRSLIGLSNVLLPGEGRRTGPYFSDEEIVHFATEALEADVIEEHERDMIESVLELGDTLVREVMVPRPEMVTVAGDTPLDEAVDLALRRGLTRLPVHDGDADDIDSVMNVKDAMRRLREGQDGDTVSSVAAPALLVPELIAVNRVLPQMRQARTHMAIVFDEHGGTAGLVTMEDLLEELVGDIEDETDRHEPLSRLRGDGSVLLRGSLSIDDANEYLETNLSDRPPEALPEGDWESVGGLIVEELGRPATIGDEVVTDGRRLTVHEMRGRRIMWVLLEPAEPDRDAPDQHDDDPAHHDDERGRDRRHERTPHDA
ncbi:MAG: HlyC/CorC family transporter [Microthrixaceae bacterium]|nr:HlyC/CorC family transporter [Microthrixaceae bacterium]